jgi:hypothetical protein
MRVLMVGSFFLKGAGRRNGKPQDPNPDKPEPNPWNREAAKVAKKC